MFLTFVGGFSNQRFITVMLTSLTVWHRLADGLYCVLQASGKVEASTIKRLHLLSSEVMRLKGKLKVLQVFSCCCCYLLLLLSPQDNHYTIGIYPALPSTQERRNPPKPSLRRKEMSYCLETKSFPKSK